MLCELMHYERAIPFPRARDALAAWCKITKEKIKIPSNCCPALLPFASELVPVSPETGLAPVPVQLYGYRQIFPGAKIEVDPLMTGLFGEPFADSTVISFGYSKTIDIGGGGAILTQDKSLAEQLTRFEFFPKILCAPLEARLELIHHIIMEKKKQYEEIESEFAPYVERLPSRPVLAWRFVAKLQQGGGDFHQWNGYRVSRNYPPLPGVTDPGAIEWGEKVINIWR
jgi:hypothetical protein